MSNSMADVSMLWLADNGYFPGTTLAEHSHQEYYQIYYIVDGKGIFTVNGEDVKMESGMFFLLVPGVRHGIKLVEGGSQGRLREFEIKFAVFNEDLAAELQRLPAANWGTPELQEGYTRIVQEALQKTPYYEERLPRLFTAWLYQMLSQRQRGGRSACKDGEDRPTARVKQYIDEHYAEELPLDKMAEVSGYSKSYLCQVFREDMGTTINNYINDVRITRAMHLLMDTQMSVAEVGEKCGYNSIFYFVKAFKKVVGIPPGSFRTDEMTGTMLLTGPVSSDNTIMKTGWISTTKRPGASSTT